MNYAPNKVAFPFLHLPGDHLLPHHSDGVVEQRLSEHQDMELFVYMHLLEDGEHGHGVDGSDQRAEQQAVEQGDVSQRALGQQTHTVQRQADAQHVPQGSQHRIPGNIYTMSRFTGNRNGCEHNTDHYHLCCNGSHQKWENISIQVMFLATWGMLVQHFTLLLAAKCCNMFMSESLTLSAGCGARRVIINFGMENINLASEWKPELEKRKHWHWNKKKVALARKQVLES